jgi:hypothetical protein
LGIEFNAVQFLRYATKKAPLGNVATLGRLSLDIPEGRLRALLPLPANYKHEQCADNFLRNQFAARSVESFDNSPFEGANHIVDMNQPLPTRFPQYDTVLDFGTLEHIYIAPQAFKNVSELCAEGGQILHILPANNFSGHGFWQFSPELFFSLYSSENGYRDTQIFLADLSQEKFWYRVFPPIRGQRIELDTWARLFVMCRTVKSADASQEDIQQSDYLARWADEKPDAAKPAAIEPPAKARKGRPVRHDSISRSINLMRHLVAGLKGDLTPRGQHPSITKIRIESLL